MILAMRFGFHQRHKDHNCLSKQANIKVMAKLKPSLKVQTDSIRAKVFT